MANRGRDVRLLVAGAGLIGKRHLEHALAHPRIEVVGLIEPQEIDVPVPRFGSIDQVDVEADAIIIATPSDLHADHAEASAARGWHMLIEKPIAADSAGAERIVQAAKSAGVQVLVGHHRRHHAAVRRLKGLLEDGAIGTPLVASLIWAMKKPDAYFEGNWRSGRDGSPVYINLVHEVDTLRYLFGEVACVSGLGAQGQRQAGRVESGVVSLGFASGMVATIAFSDAAPSPWGFEAGTGENPNIATTAQDMFRIIGAKGAISFPSLRVWSGSSDWSEAAKSEVVEVAPNEPLVDQLEHFCEVVAGRASPLVDAKEGAATLAATIEIEQAVGRFDWVAV